MRSNEYKPTPENATADNNAEPSSPSPPGKEDNRFMRILKKTGFTVWLAVMVIGGALAFIVALFLV